MPPRIALHFTALRLLLLLQAAGGVNVVVKAGQAALLVQDAFRVPLLEVCLGAGA